MSSKPYSKLVEILRYQLEQVKKDLALYPDDAHLTKLKQSLQWRLKDLERSADPESDTGT
jgi:hypothetical protein